MARLTFFGAAGMVSGSCYRIESRGRSILIDCGMFQGSKEIKELNYGSFPFEPASIDAVLLTHAHLDHAGLLPKLSRLGFRGKVYCTEATAALCRPILLDSAGVQRSEVDRKNRKNKRAGKPEIQPIYDAGDVERCLTRLRGVNYGEVVEVLPGIRARFLNSGHIFGSATIEVWVDDPPVKVVFSGDLGHPGQPIVEDPTIVTEADYVVMESTYGDRIRQPEDTRGELAKAIRDTFDRGGNVIIPAFAVERTQDLLHILDGLTRDGVIPPGSIFVDSPLARDVTKVFLTMPEYYDRETTEELRAGRDPLLPPGMRFITTPEDSMALNSIRRGAIIIAGSGMCDAGRIKHHLRHNLWRPECTVLFAGYQAEGTLGWKLLRGDRFVRIHGEEVAVKAEIKKIEGLSAHADQTGLLEWAGAFEPRPKAFYMTHGDPRSSSTLAEIVSRATGAAAFVPQLFSTSELDPSRDARPVRAPAGEVAEEMSLEDAYWRLGVLVRNIPRDMKGRAAAILAHASEALRRLGSAG